MKDSDLQGGDRPALTTLQDHGLGSAGEGMELAPFLQGEVTKDCELGERDADRERRAIL